jgi:site-specific DNA-methyltransferase (adenine-specific)
VTEAYQLFPPLRDEEYQALKADIAKRGVMVPVERDEGGRVLDGHHRVRACRELGLPDPPAVTRSGLDEPGKVEHALKANLLRRHLGPVAWAEAFKRLAEVRGVELDGKGGRPRAGENPVTVAGLAEELGVPYRTARRRLQVGEELAGHPDLAARVDAGDMDVKRARVLVRERRPAPDVAPITLAAPDVELRLGRFQEVLGDLEAGSVNLVLTDPPYGRKWLDIWSDLGAFAARVLKPGRLLVAYTGKLELPEVLTRLCERMAYVWLGGVFQQPGTRHAAVQPLHVRETWRPVLLFSAGPYAPGSWFEDGLISPGREKDGHPWQQSAGPVRYLVERLTDPGALVVDPFLGSGTTAVACQQLGRRFVGCDTDPRAVDIARERLA